MDETKRKRGRPSTDTSQSTITMQNETWMVIDKIADELGCGRSRVIESIINDYANLPDRHEISIEDYKPKKN